MGQYRWFASADNTFVAGSCTCSKAKHFSEIKTRNATQ